MTSCLHEPEAVHLVSDPHLVQELDASAGAGAGETAEARARIRSARMPCACACPQGLRVGAGQYTVYSVTRTDMQTSNATASMGYCAGDRGRQQVASVPVPLAWNSTSSSREEGLPAAHPSAHPRARNAADMKQAP